MSVSRRVFLAAAGLSGLALPSIAGDGPELPIDSTHVRVSTRRWSTARGRTVTMIVYAPPSVPLTNAPVCLLLHGLHGDAAHAALPGMSEAMHRLRTRFVFVAVDGGDNYWHDARPGDDPMAMLLDEIPTWLSEYGLARTPFAVTGVSMGGFGALLYARRRIERRVPIRAVAAVSPGLLLSWETMRTRHAFRDEAQWAELDPLRHPDALGATPTAMWCGDKDPFVVGVREYGELTESTDIHISPGAHNLAFFGAAAPDVVRFIDDHDRHTSPVAQPGR